MKHLLLLCCLFFTLAGSAQTSLYVDSAKAASGAGTSWATAYKTLNEALNIANSASTTVLFEINIARGTYYPPGPQTSTNRDSTFLLSRGGIRLNGGFPSGGGARNITVNPTVLSGNIGNAGTNADNSYHLIVLSNIAAAADSNIISGLRITAGNANGTGGKVFNTLSVIRTSGGAIHALNAANIVRIDSCTIDQSRCSANGGALYAANANISMTGTAFTADSCATAGGAVYVTGSSLRLWDGAFTGNFAGGQGGACHSFSSRPVITRCSFTSNRSYGDGGALYLTRSLITGPATAVTYCTFTGNTTTIPFGAGGGIFTYCVTNGPTYFTDIYQFNIFTGNSAANGGAFYGSHAYSNHAVGYLKGNTFTGNYASANAGGLYCASDISAGAGAEVDSNIVIGNKAGNTGGGIVTAGGGSVVSRCILTSDSALLGGGIYRSGGIVRTCRITSCYAQNGGGIYSAFGGNGDPNSILNDTVSGNYAVGNGGGLVNYTTSPAIHNVLLSGNVAGSRGGAVYDSATSWPGITNCTLAGDTAATGNGVYNTGNCNPSIINCIVWEGSGTGIVNVSSTPVVQYTNIQGGYTGPANLATAPGFAAPLPPTGTPTTGGSYVILPPCSPVINSGSNFGSYAGQSDLAGNPRLFGGVVDRGAYEYQDTNPPTITGNSSVCTGNPLQLSHPASGGTWTSSNPAIATVSSTGLVIAIGNGAVTISYAHTLFGCTGTSTKTITAGLTPPVPLITGADTVCIGAAVQLSASPAASTWTSSNPAILTVSNGLVTGVSTGTATITATTAGNGCTAKDTQLVTVYPLPVVPPITGSSALCAGGTQLGNPAPGGVWTSAYPALATVSPTGFVTQLAPGVIVVGIIYTVTNSHGCAASTSIVLNTALVPSPGAITGPPGVCIGGTAQLSNLVTTGAWSSTNPAVATVSSTGLVTSVSTGSTIIAYTTTGTGGCTSSATKPFYVGAPSVNTVSATICAGQSYILGPQTLTSPGTYQQMLQSLAGCDSAVTLNLSVAPPPVSGVSVSGSTIIALEAGGSYEWIDCNTGTPLPGQTGQSLAAPYVGSFKVVISKNGCSVTSQCIPVYDLGVGGHAAAADIRIYPNPASTLLTIETGSSRALQITLADITGRALLTLKPNAITSMIDLHLVPPGIYSIIIHTADGSRTTRAISVVR